MPVIAASSPSQCFHAAIEAARIALKYRTPVYLLSDAYLANGSEPWLIPDVAELPSIATSVRDGTERRRPVPALPARPETLARPWAVPGTPGLEHRIGGLEKADVTGAISYDPDNHDRMVRLRAQKVANIAADIPELEVDDPDGDARTLVLGWGSTYGPIGAAVRRVRARGPQGRERASPLSEPVPAEHGRGAPPLREGARAGDEHRAATAADPRRVPRRRRRLQPRPRAAVPVERARRGDHGLGGGMSFSAVVTGDERVLVSRDGRQVVALAGTDARA